MPPKLPKGKQTSIETTLLWSVNPSDDFAIIMMHASTQLMAQEDVISKQESALNFNVPRGHNARSFVMLA